MDSDYRGFGRVDPGLASFRYHNPVAERNGPGMGFISTLATTKVGDYLDCGSLSGLSWFLATIRAHDLQPYVRRTDHVLRLLGIDALGCPEEWRIFLRRPVLCADHLLITHHSIELVFFGILYRTGAPTTCFPMAGNREWKPQPLGME